METFEKYGYTWIKHKAIKGVEIPKGLDPYDCVYVLFHDENNNKPSSYEGVAERAEDYDWEEFPDTPSLKGWEIIGYRLA